MELYTLVGPSLRQLMRYRSSPKEKVTSDFRQKANFVVTDLPALSQALEGSKTLDQGQAHYFHHFFFLSVPYTSPTLLPPRPESRHQVGTQWLLDLLRLAADEKQDQIADRLFANISSTRRHV